ncbi:hypothetical protein [Streptosporangium minutum]|uniref:hypothetical protein n=1 Tax=Streptosporangium minutum TaxID=569862 RepID=UPI001A984BAB|nr:hypothetical protein [Streptosporangium minutum]
MDGSDTGDHPDDHMPIPAAARNPQTSAGRRSRSPGIHGQGRGRCDRIGRGRGGGGQAGRMSTLTRDP